MLTHTLPFQILPLRGVTVVRAADLDEQCTREERRNEQGAAW